MTDSIIVKYLAGNRRLTIPGLGTFLRKDNGEVVFMELLKKDDGVLASLVAAESGTDEAKAREDIATYAATVRRACATAGRHPIEGLGTLSVGQNGTLKLIAQHGKATLAAAPEVSANAEKMNAADQSEAQAATTDKAVESAPTTTGVAENSASRPVQPMAQGSLQVRSAGQPAGRGAAQPRQASRRKKSTDMVLVVAIIVAILALGAIVYGMMSDTNPIENLRPTSQPAEILPADSTSE